MGRSVVVGVLMGDLAGVVVDEMGRRVGGSFLKGC